MKNINAPRNFSVPVSDWENIENEFVGRGYRAEISANGVTAADFPDVYFDESSISYASAADIIVSTDTNKVILYAKNIPIAELSGVYFIKKGVTA